MVIHYLQVIKNPILPKVQELEKAININVSLKALPQLIRCLPQVNLFVENELWCHINYDPCFQMFCLKTMNFKV
jgi:hypothetical protein